ncbi:MAG: extracellular solute-binding protein [Acidipropionibacterium acidipropionici]|nr:extracellular solute-binding protein [Acidipropionibacterium acidipropionici]
MALAATALAGCSSPVGAGLFGSQLDPSTLIFWNLFAGGDGARMQAMEAGYGKTYGPGSLQATTFAWGNPYYTKVTLATVGNKPPDVTVSHLTRAKPLREGDIIEDITDADLASVGLSPSDFATKPWKAQVTGGRTVAIPLDTHPFVLFFNSEVCRKAGLLGADGDLKELQGLEDFEAALKAISAVTGGTAITVANVGGETATPWRLFWTLYNQRQGATPFISGDGTKLTVDEDLFVDTVTRIQSWVRKGWLNKGLDYATAQTYMFTGKAGMYLQGEWEISTAQSVKGLHFGMTRIPTVYDRPAAQADSHCFIIPRKKRTDKQRHQVMLFIKKMLEQSMTWAEGGHIPAYQPVARSTAYRDLSPQSNYSSAADVAVYDDPTWYGGSGSTFENIVGAQLGLAQQLSVTPQRALTVIKQQLRVYLDTESPL